MHSKRILSLFLVTIFICSIFLLTSCNNDNKGGDFKMPIFPLDNGNRGDTIVGKFIKCAEVSPKEAEVLINDHGMSGLRAPNHLHNTKAEFSYKTSKNGEDGAITFTFPQVESLGYMYIWNYNGNGETNNGMKEVKIEYSIDGENWESFGDGKYELAEALSAENQQYGGNAANNVNDGNRTPIDFKGVPVKYVRITPLSNHGGTEYGLSEVRFFRYKTRPGANTLLAVNADCPLGSNENISSLVNNMGLSDLFSETATHNNNPDDMWYVESDNASDAMIIFDLDGTYPLSKLVFWNYNKPSETNNGIKEIKVEYTVKSPNKIENGKIDFNGGNWTELGTYTIPEATGEDNLAPSLSIDLENIHAQHIRITPKSNYGGSGFGLSAIRLFTGYGWAVEPSREWTGLFSSEGSFPYQRSGQNPRNGFGWLAADGIYTIHMNGPDMIGSANESSKTLFLFSDTGIGNFRNYSGTFGKHGDNISLADMRNHSMVTLIGNKPDPRNMQVYLHSGEGYDNIFNIVSWAQELVRIDNKLYSFAMRFTGWDPTQYDLVEFDIGSNDFPDFTKKPKLTEAFPIKVKGDNYSYDFSAALINNTESGGASTHPDGYIYIYGMHSYNNGFWLYKAPIVARVLPEHFTDRSKWRFWNGSDWDEDLKNATNINADGADVSSEYSVTYITEGPYKGKYMMTYTKDTMFNELCFRIADTPYGPFGEATTMYYCPEVYTILRDTGVNDIYTYNAKAHPHLSEEGELLMTYNVNSRSFKTAMEFLHPQFLKMFFID